MGEELLIEAILVDRPENDKPAEDTEEVVGEEELSNEEIIKIKIGESVRNLQSRLFGDMPKEGLIEYSSEFDIRLYTDHWFVQNTIKGIEEDSEWGKQEESGNQINRFDIHSSIDDVVRYNFRDLNAKRSILLDFPEQNIYNMETLYDWSPECEKAGEKVKDLLYDDHKEYIDSRTYDADWEEWESEYDEDDEVYKNAALYEYLKKDPISSINEVLIRMFYRWAQVVNTTIRDNEKLLHYIGPLRFFPERYDFSFSNKKSDSENSESIWQLIKDSESAKDKLNKWLSSEKLKTPYELQFQKHIQINEQTIEQMKEIFQRNPDKALETVERDIPFIKEMTFYDKRYDTAVNIREMGLGVSQVLPVLVNLFQKTDKLIAVEQPELHLHPSVQSDLADEFIKSYKKNNNTFLIETHSEHLLLRIMRRMRQTSEGTLEDEELALTPDDVSLLYVDADNDKTYILELELAEDGSLLDPWPGGFFEEGFRERFL